MSTILENRSGILTENCLICGRLKKIWLSADLVEN